MSTFLTLYESGRVRRFHTVDSINYQSTAEHQWGVALIVRVLYGGDPPADVLMAALLHDAPEIMTGDVPAHVKWNNPDLKAALDAVETEVSIRLGIHYDLSAEDRKMVKMADMLELIFFAITQVRLGNQNLRIVFERGIQWMAEHRDWWNREAEQLFNLAVKEYGNVGA